MGIKIKNLKIIALNVNSLIKHTRRANLKDFIGSTNPDLLLLSETKLNPKLRISFDGFNIARNDRPSNRRGGGTAILIKDGIKYEELLYKNTAANPSLEATIIRINCAHKNLHIVSVYATNIS